MPAYGSPIRLSRRGATRNCPGPASAAGLRAAQHLRPTPPGVPPATAGDLWSANPKFYSWADTRSAQSRIGRSHSVERNRDAEAGRLEWLALLRGLVMGAG